ncbi:unnamed protein product [Brassicogethes aeneus]|uniref:Uncharacterized protein n=1 Tax=Brassicogethes aeneus TaxID=1431903 RepID=A0A9P0BB93_BRAAE|nr:unnamed protein product [Brassicogethes aeneus]
MGEINWVCRKCGSKSSVVDASTQTPADYVVSFQDLSFSHMCPLPNTNSERPFVFTDWNQMGRVLRQIADDLHRISTTDLNSSSIEEVQMDQSSYCTPYSRHSVPDGVYYRRC